MNPKKNKFVSLVNEDEVISLTKDTKLVALRWDLIDWGLVLDLDVPQSENSDAPVSRAWLVFQGVSEITLPLKDTRLPNGCFLSSYVNIRASFNGLHDFTFNAMLPTFNGETILQPVTKEIVIRAKAILGAISIKSAAPDNFSFLSRATRMRLADDEEMLSVIVNQL